MIGVTLALLAARHGVLVFVGSPNLPQSVLEGLPEWSGNRNPQVVVLTRSKKPFVVTGQRAVVFKTSSYASKSEVEDVIKSTDAVILPEGDGEVMVKALGRDWCQDLFTKFIDRGGAWIGLKSSATWAGDPRLENGKVVPGLGIFDGVVEVDYYAKHRELDLRRAYFGSRVLHGIGLDEDQWIVFRDGVIEKKIGLPQVFLREAG